MTDQSPAPAKHFRRRRVLTIAVLSAGLALAATLIVSNPGAQASQCAAQPLLAQKIDAAATGQLAALGGTGQGRGYEDLAFTDANGAPKTIADFKGKKLLVNFWASWCVPCRAEMPALDEVAGQYNSDFFQVVPVNLDVGNGGLEKAKAFLANGKFEHLPLYADSSMSAFERLKTNAVALGLPATLILDAKGCELAVLQGPAEWDSADGHRVIETLLAL
jgi:thiol-disulfide isomerase/thioredoxin